MRQKRKLAKKGLKTIKEAINNNLNQINWSPTPHLDLQILISHILQKDKNFILTNPQYLIEENQLKKLKQFIRRRSNHEPIAYITRQKYFYAHKFHITPNVLIPRPETEILVEEALQTLVSKNAKKIVEVGTGSGCIILSIAKEIPNLNDLYFIATDISSKALEVAQRNQRKLFPHEKSTVTFIECDLLDKVKERIDLLIANLPYIPNNQYQTLEKNVKEYEPRQALVGGKEGTEIIETLLEQAKGRMNQKSTILLEINFDQRERVTKIAQKLYPESKVSAIKDYANFDRIVKIEIP